jgi:hypothetical protein
LILVFEIVQDRAKVDQNARNYRLPLSL